MAYVGLAMPAIKPETGAGMILGKAVGVDIEPQYSEASLFGDNTKAEYDKSFKSAKVKLEVTTLPLQAHNMLFGHMVTDATEGKEASVINKASDSAKYVGFGVYTEEKVDGASKFVAAWMQKVKFTDPTNSWTTKGDSIEYKTATIEGEALAGDDGIWKETHIFATEAEVVDYLKEKCGITEATEA